ncbi:MAG: hypothetical protein ACI9MJ_001865, partial [Alphaproteobacteria bacterium]
KQPARPAKEWIYPLGLLALGLAIFSQIRRQRRAEEAAPG